MKISPREQRSNLEQHYSRNKIFNTVLWDPSGLLFLYNSLRKKCMCSTRTYRPNVKLVHSDLRIVDHFQAVIILSMLEVRLLLFSTTAGLLYKAISVIRCVNCCNISLAINIVTCICHTLTALNGRNRLWLTSKQYFRHIFWVCLY
jgi:hypothetical protein